MRCQASREKQSARDGSQRPLSAVKILCRFRIETEREAIFRGGQVADASGKADPAGLGRVVRRDLVGEVLAELPQIET
jgi:hypothetical protein